MATKQPKVNQKNNSHAAAESISSSSDFLGKSLAPPPFQLNSGAVIQQKPDKNSGFLDTLRSVVTGASQARSVVGGLVSGAQRVNENGGLGSRILGGLGSLGQKLTSNSPRLSRLSTGVQNNYSKVMGIGGYGLRFLGNMLNGQSAGEAASETAGGGLASSAFSTAWGKANPSGSAADLAINIFNSGAQLFGAPKEFTDLTGLVADVTPSANVSRGAGLAARSVYNVQDAVRNGNTQGLERQTADVREGRLGSAFQGYGLFGELIAGNTNNLSEMASNRAASGDYGIAPALGNHISDSWMNTSFAGTNAGDLVDGDVMGGALDLIVQDWKDMF